MTDVFLGVDIEATGADPQPPGAKPHYQRFLLCQLGIAELYVNEVDATLYGRRPEPRWFSSLVGADDFEFEQEAMDVHKITPEQIRAAPRPAQVDAAAAAWLDERGIRRAIPVGYSVGSFDAPYIREWLPETARRLSMRAVDLNAIVFLIAKITGRSYKATKIAGKLYAEKRIKEDIPPEKVPGGPHNAAFDALVAIYSYEYFKSILFMKEIHDHF